MSQCQPERNFVSTYLRRCEAYDFIVEDLPLFPERGLWDTIDLAGFDLMKGRGVLCEVLPLPPGNVIGEPDRQTIQTNGLLKSEANDLWYELARPEGGSQR